MQIKYDRSLALKLTICIYLEIFNLKRVYGHSVCCAQKQKVKEKLKLKNCTKKSRNRKSS